MLCLYFTDAPVRNLDDVTVSDRARWTRFFQGMLQRGVYLAPSQFEAAFVSLVHDEDDVGPRSMPPPSSLLTLVAPPLCCCHSA